MSSRVLTSPTPDAETAPFWAAAKQGQFLLRRCSACEKTHWAPRSICPFCMSLETVWIEGAGRGVIYSYTVLRQATAPYAIAYVQLEEGPKMLTHIVEADLNQINVGQAVELVFVASDGEYPLPCFRPA